MTGIQHLAKAELLYMINSKLKFDNTHDEPVFKILL